MMRIVCLDRQAILDDFLPPGQHDDDRVSRQAGITGRLMPPGQHDENRVSRQAGITGRLTATRPV